ncbi:MAG: pectate lyase [Verrucomicrobiota bacterium]
MNRTAILMLLASLVLTPLRAGPVTLEAVGRLPEAERQEWRDYIARSATRALADQTALKAELVANDMTAALKAPSGGDFKLSHETGDAWYSGGEAAALAATVLSYQTVSGGWSKHTGYSRGPRLPGMQWSSQSEPGEAPHYLATFDNRSTTEQLEFLGNLWLATRRGDCEAGFIKGLDFIFDAQFPNGGWPQVYPLEGGYHDGITFNDDAMKHILELLKSVAGNDLRFTFLDEARRLKAAEALGKGIRCVVRTQVVQDGRKTAWCAQHDPLTLAPDQARKMEPVALSGLESANLLAFLMTIANPSPEVAASIESGLAWLDRVKVTGMTRTSREGKTTYEPDPQSSEIYWARFYSLTDSKPVFPGRDGVLYPTFWEMAAKNKLGYDFYTTRPGSVVNNGRKKWRKMLSGSKP